MFGSVFSCSRVILDRQLLTLIVKDANVAEQWAVNSAGECHVDIVEVASSILASPTKASCYWKSNGMLFLILNSL